MRTSYRSLLFDRLVVAPQVRLGTPPEEFTKDLPCCARKLCEQTRIGLERHANHHHRVPLVGPRKTFWTVPRYLRIALDPNTTPDCRCDDCAFVYLFVSATPAQYRWVNLRCTFSRHKDTKDCAVSNQGQLSDKSISWTASSIVLQPRPGCRSLLTRTSGTHPHPVGEWPNCPI